MGTEKSRRLRKQRKRPKRQRFSERLLWTRKRS